MRDRWLWFGCVAYAAIFTGLGALKYFAHRNLVDFGIFLQTAGSAFGCFCNPIEGSHWAFHFSPVLYLAGAAVELVRSPLTLVALQAVAGALVAPPVYGLVLRARGDVAAARLAALIVWLYPPLAGLVFGDFHENGFAPAAIAWMLYFFDGGMLLATLVAAAVALAIKEDQAIFLAIAGTFGWLRFRGTSHGRTALLICGASLIVAFLFFKEVQPHAAANPAWQPERFYAWTTADGQTLLAGLAARAGFVALAFVPLLFLPFRSRMMWLAAAPLAEVLLSRMSTTFTMGSHYAGAWLGYVLVAFAFALRRTEARRIRALAGWCAGLCVLELIVADPLHPGLNLRLPQPRDAALDTFLRKLPEGVSIATQEEAYTHLALGNPYARLLPERPSALTQACFVLVDRDFADSPRLQEYGPRLATLVSAGTYALAERVGGIELYRNTGTCR